MSIGIKDQYFGCEIEMTGITRDEAAKTIAEVFGTSYSRQGSIYDTHCITDREGKEWKIVRDSSIHCTKKRAGRQVSAGQEYAVEMNSPKLEYSEMKKLQSVVRALRHAGAVVNDSCGMHVHIDAAPHTPQTLKNALSIMYSKEDILFLALKVNESRVQRWCKKVNQDTVTRARRLPKTATMQQFEDVWYRGSYGSRSAHYNETRYHALNLHAVFTHGTLEWRCFESTLHAGEVRANITLALAISAQALNQQRTVLRKTPIGDNPAFTFRTFLLRLGLIGPEYKSVREHLLKNLPGDRAWRYDRSHYPSLQPHSQQHEEEAR